MQVIKRKEMKTLEFIALLQLQILKKIESYRWYAGHAGIDKTESSHSMSIETTLDIAFEFMLDVFHGIHAQRRICCWFAVQLLIIYAFCKDGKEHFILHR